MLGAHTHMTQIIGNKDFALLTTPSVSLITYSNPGFTTFELDHTVNNIKLHYLNMAWYYLFKSVTFEITDFGKEFGIKEFTP